MTERSYSRSIFSIIFWYCLRVVGWSLLAWFLFTVVALLFCYRLNFNETFSHLSFILDKELSYFYEVTQLSSYKIVVAETTSLQYWDSVFGSLSSLHFKKNPFLHSLSENSFNTFLSYLKIIVVSTKIICAKLFNVFTFFLTYILLGFAGCVDGLVCRKLRRFNGLRESSLTYHYAKKMMGSVFLSNLFIYLILPWAFEPSYILVPGALTYGFLMHIVFKQLKKYL